MEPGKIISGGQTGVDQAALEFAMILNIDCGGWCDITDWIDKSQINILNIAGPAESKYPGIESATYNIFSGSIFLSL